MTNCRGWFCRASASLSASTASAWALAAAMARASRAALYSSASRSSRTSRMFRSVASRRSARGSTQREVEDPPTTPTMEAAGTRPRERGALFDKLRKKGLEKHQPKKKKNESHKNSDTYAETACDCFTTLRKRAAFAAASSRLVATAVLLGFFGRLPKWVDTARCFYAPPWAVGPADGPAPW